MVPVESTIQNKTLKNYRFYVHNRTTQLIVCRRRSDMFETYLKQQEF